jgi:hypothetical protein
MVQSSDKDDSPVMFIEMKAPRDLYLDTSREDAAIQIRERFESLAQQIRIPKLYGVSAFGRNFACFCYDATSRMITPPIIKNKGVFLADVKPIDLWSANIMQPEGRDRFLHIVDEVKEMTQRRKWYLPIVFLLTSQELKHVNSLYLCLTFAVLACI